MSVALMTLAWKSTYPAGKKMVLLALCDNANDQGECFPSVSMLVDKCSMSERSVFNHIADLEKDGAIKRNNRAGRSTVYQLDPCKFCTPEQPLTPATVAEVKPLTPANSAPLPLQPLHHTPAMVAPTPATVAPITIKEPSSNQIPNTKDKAQAPSFVLPDWIDKKHWDAWHSCAKRKKTTPEQKQLAVDKLDKWRSEGKDFAGALENAAVGGWQGLFLPDQKTVTKPAGKHSGFNNLDYREGIEEDGTLA